MSKDTKGSDGGPAPVRAGGKRLPAAAADAVGRKLKASYSELLREPIPDKFMQLLQQLDEGAALPQSGQPDDEPASKPGPQASVGSSSAGRSVKTDSSGKED